MFGKRDTAALIDAMAVAARAESMAIAQRFEAIAALHRERCRNEEAQFWHTDVFEAVAAEVSAAQNISRGRARNQVRSAVWLHERLPQVAAVFARGDIDYRVLQAVVARTENVEDDIIAGLDESLARQVHKWMRLSKNKLRDRIDVWVADYDPAAVRVPPLVAKNCYVDVEPHPEAAGVATVGGVLDAVDAAAFDQRLNLIAESVCAHDPRSKAQRRAAPAAHWGAVRDRWPACADWRTARRRRSASPRRRWSSMCWLSRPRSREPVDGPGICRTRGVAGRVGPPGGKDGKAQADSAARYRSRIGVPALRRSTRFSAVAGSDVPVPGL